MTNVQKNIVFSNPPLDKLAQLVHRPGQTTTLQTSETLVKRAKAKYFTNAYTKSLASLKSPLQKSYNNTIFGCSNSLVQTEQKITTRYCGNRWCVVCNRIRTAKMINGYKKQLDELENTYFVTLTIPNVNGDILRSTIKEMTKTFQNILKKFHHDKVKVVLLRKLECTYNPIRNDFHPHFHLLVSEHSLAKEIVSEWLKRCKTASIQAQDIRKADKGSSMELFKYFSKIITDKKIYVNALDTIFQAMRGLRVYQPVGIKKVSEEIEEVQAQIYEELERAEKIWTWIEEDWIDVHSGECLTGYTPDTRIKELVEKNISTNAEI